MGPIHELQEECLESPPHVLSIIKLANVLNSLDFESLALCRGKAEDPVDRMA